MFYFLWLISFFEEKLLFSMKFCDFYALSLSMSSVFSLGKLHLKPGSHISHISNNSTELIEQNVGKWTSFAVQGKLVPIKKSVIIIPLMPSRRAEKCPSGIIRIYYLFFHRRKEENQFKGYDWCHQSIEKWIK